MTCEIIRPQKFIWLNQKSNVIDNFIYIIDIFSLSFFQEFHSS